MEAISGVGSAGIQSLYSFHEIQKTIRAQSQALQNVKEVTTDEERNKINQFLSDISRYGSSNNSEDLQVLIQKTENFIEFLTKQNPELLELFPDHRAGETYEKYSDRKKIEAVFSGMYNLNGSGGVSASSAEASAGKQVALQTLGALGMGARFDTSHLLKGKLQEVEKGERQTGLFEQDEASIIEAIISGRGIQDIDDMIYIVTLIAQADGAIPVSLLQRVDVAFKSFIEEYVANATNINDIKAFMAIVGDVLAQFEEQMSGSGLDSSGLQTSVIDNQLQSLSVSGIGSGDSLENIEDEDGMTMLVKKIQEEESKRLSADQEELEDKLSEKAVKETGKYIPQATKKQDDVELKEGVFRVDASERSALRIEVTSEASSSGESDESKAYTKEILKNIKEKGLKAERAGVVSVGLELTTKFIEEKMHDQLDQAERKLSALGF